MVQFAGKYKLEKNENYTEYIASIGVPADVACQAENKGKETTITVEGKTFTINDGEKPTVIKIGEEWEDKIEAFNITLKSKAKLEGNKLVVTATSSDGRVGTRVFEFTDAGFVVTLTNGDVVGKRYYSRM